MRHVDYSDEMPGSYDWWYAGDKHKGTVGYKRKLFSKFKRRVKAKKHAYVSLGGDLIEGIAPDDKRFNIFATEPRAVTINKQIRSEVDENMSIADRIKIILFGNHELTIMRRSGGINPAVEIARGLGVTYPKTIGKGARDDDEPEMGDSFQVKVNLPTVRFLERHGMRNFHSRAVDEQMAQTHEARWVKTQLRRLASDCEVNVMHHIHSLRVYPPTAPLRMVSDFDNGHGSVRGIYPIPTRIPLNPKKPGGAFRIHHDEAWYGSAGAWLGTYEEGVSTYAEVGGYDHTELGALRMVVKNDKLLGIEKVPFS